jgi:hypothetical protein
VRAPHRREGRSSGSSLFFYLDNCPVPARAGETSFTPLTWNRRAPARSLLRGRSDTRAPPRKPTTGALVRSLAHERVAEDVLIGADGARRAPLAAALPLRLEAQRRELPPAWGGARNGGATAWRRSRPHKNRYKIPSGNAPGSSPPFFLSDMGIEPHPCGGSSGVSAARSGLPWALGEESYEHERALSCTRCSLRR